VTLREGDIVTVDGDRGLLARGRHELGEPVADPAVKQLLSWCAERASVPVLTGPDVTGLASVNTLDQLAACSARAVLRLDDPATIPAAELTKSLQARESAAPVLCATPAWLRAADSHLRGRVSGIVLPDGSLSGALLQAILTLDAGS
jgi:hypothetical protein